MFSFRPFNYSFFRANSSSRLTSSWCSMEPSAWAWSSWRRRPRWKDVPASARSLRPPDFSSSPSSSWSSSPSSGPKPEVIPTAFSKRFWSFYHFCTYTSPFCYVVINTNEFFIAIFVWINISKTESYNRFILFHTLVFRKKFRIVFKSVLNFTSIT